MTITTKPKTVNKAKQYDNLVKAYILSRIDVSEYVGYCGVEKEPTNEKESLQELHKIFMEEFHWRVKQIGLIPALAEWLAGLPSSINIAFMNCDIVKLGELWGVLPEDASENQQMGYIENWFNLMANKLVQLWRKEKVI